MSLNIGGLHYEQAVRDAIRLSQNNKINLIHDTTAGFDSNSPDLTLMYGYRAIHIECKMHNAQMGERSIRYHAGLFSFETGSVLDQLIEPLLEERRPHFNALFDFLQNEPHCSKTAGFPYRTSKDAWTKAVRNKLVAPIAANVPFDDSIVKQHYRNKDCHYIQIQKRGLYHLGDDVFNLGVPELKAQANVELRAKRSGSQLVKSVGAHLANVTYIAAGRLNMKTLEPSPFTLDDSISVDRLFAKL